MFFVENERVMNAERRDQFSDSGRLAGAKSQYPCKGNSSVGGRHVWTHPASEPSVDPGAVASGLVTLIHSHPNLVNCSVWIKAH
jgi:hypothetical protein